MAERRGPSRRPPSPESLPARIVLVDRRATPFNLDPACRAVILDAATRASDLPWLEILRRPVLLRYDFEDDVQARKSAVPDRFEILMLCTIVSTSKRTDLIETTARWRWDAFFRKSGRTFEETLEAERRGASTATLMPQIMVLLAAGEPIGMATLAESDLDTRPDLTPWLPGVFVVPEARGRGHASRLVAAVEGLASAASIPTLWLYTRTAESLYVRAGWRTVDRLEKAAQHYALMRRDLGPPVV